MKKRLFPLDPVMIVDDEITVAKTFKMALGSGGINNTLLVHDSQEVIPLISRQEISVILLDINMPEISGNKLLEILSKDFPAIPVIMITGNDEVEMAVECMKKDAFDYMVKPVEKSRLVSGVKRAVKIRLLDQENRLLKEQMYSSQLENPDVFKPMITNNKEMKILFKYVESVSKSPHPILITGKTGTGKELMAQAIHKLYCDLGPFVSINVAGIDDNAFTDTLFGHVKGAFTGANTKRLGLVEKASGGTLFLDEIGDLKPESQIKLLRLLQEHEYFTLGSDVPKIMDTRILVATNQDLKTEQESGRFRKDLYYRLSAHHIHIPPLYQRMDDLPLLLDFFLKEAARIYEKPKPSFPIELITLLSNYHFPGNIRELKGMIFDAVSVHKSKKLSMDTFKITIKQNQPSVRKTNSPDLSSDSGFAGFATLPTIADAQYLLMKEALRRTNNNKSMAAQMLGISRQKLIRHLKNSEQ